MLAIADTVTVLRGGRLVDGPLPCDAINADKLAELIIGANEAKNLNPDDKAALTGTTIVTHANENANDVTGKIVPILRMNNVSTRPDPEGPALDQVDLEIRPGEIIGVAGVEGNGQRTLARAIAAMADVIDGTIALDSKELTDAPLAARRAAGLRIIPFERNVEGLNLTGPLWENWAARNLLQMPLLSTINPAAIRKQCDAALKQ